MDLTAKIRLFWAAVYGLIWVLFKFPNSRLTTVLFSWRGPEPRINETQSMFNVRVGAFYLNWAMQSLGLFLLLWFSVIKWPGIGESQYFLLFWIAFALLFLLFASAAVLSFLRSLKYRWFGPNAIYTEKSGVQD